MKRHLIIISALVATVVATPALAFAIGGHGPGGCDDQGSGAHGGMRGLGGRAALTQEALKSATVTMDTAITEALDNVPGSVAMARLSPMTPPGAQETRNAFSGPELKPTYMVLVVDGDTHSMVTVDAATGDVAVIGAASGVTFGTGRGIGMGMEQGSRGPKGQGGQRGGPSGRERPADLSTAKVSASEAIAKATAATEGGTATLVRGAQRGTDTAWVVSVQPADGTGAPSRVFIDPDSGEVLRIQQMPQPGSRQGQNRGQGPQKAR